MTGLTQGRIVHYVSSMTEHSPAMVTQVLGGKEYKVSLVVFGTASIAFVRAAYSEKPALGTWHWVEPA